MAARAGSWRAGAAVVAAVAATVLFTASSAAGAPAPAGLEHGGAAWCIAQGWPAGHLSCDVCTALAEGGRAAAEAVAECGTCCTSPLAFSAPAPPYLRATLRYVRSADHNGGVGEFIDKAASKFSSLTVEGNAGGSPRVVFHKARRPRPDDVTVGVKGWHDAAIGRLLVSYLKGAGAEAEEEDD